MRLCEDAARELLAANPCEESARRRPRAGARGGSGREEGSEPARLESRDDGKLTRATSPEVQAVSATFHDWAGAADRTCICGSRTPIQCSLSDASIQRVATIAKPIGLGDPLDPETATGPLAFEG